MVRIFMDFNTVSFDRRTLLAHVSGAAAAAAVWPATAVLAQTPRPRLPLKLSPATLRLKDDGVETPVWAFDTPTPPVPRFRRGDEVQAVITNDLPLRAGVTWRGLGGGPAARAVLPPAIAPGETTSQRLALRNGGTYFFDARLPLDAAAGGATMRPLPSGAFVVTEQKPPQTDRDEVLLVEEWRLRDDGVLALPGIAGDAPKAIYTVNGKTSADIAVHANERIRLRFINGCQRAAIAFKIEGHEAVVMAIDSAPAEPFPARDGRLILAPGTRIDVFVDAVRPPGSVSPILLHDGTTPRSIARLVYTPEPPVRDAPLPTPAPLDASDLPRHLDLRGALRSELTLSDAAAHGWSAPATLGKTPAFKVRRGRTVILKLTNHDAAPNVFRIHGHHVRLLDRLDDGWKPFWLDTLLLDAGQSQLVAFAANYPGAWLMEMMRPDWSAPVRAHWFAVE